ncbi:MAG: hypothetical protein RIS29_2458 [Bacteroidota bacterium]|jgi:hypothetical protein
MPTKKDILFARSRYDKGAKFYATHNINPQPAQLRVAVPFLANIGSYRFDVTKDQSLALAVEQLLRRNDLFVARAIGLALMVEPTAAPGTAPLYSYPVVTGELATGLKGLTNTNAYAMYQGVLGMKTGTTTIFSKFPTNRFLHVPRTQPGLSYTGDAASVHPEFDLANILEELPEEFIFAGTKAQPITLDFPPCTIEGEANTKAFAVLILDGWLYEGGAAENLHTNEKSPIQNPYNDAF